MRTLRILCFVIFFTAATIFPVADFSFAEASAPDLDIMFVLDCSGSMKTSDSEESAKELIELFAAVSNPESIRIGIAAYNDKIIASLPPANLADESEKSALLSTLYALAPRGNTDIGLGLAQARALLSEDASRARAVIVLSDGETYMGRSGRGEDVSNRDAEDALLWAKENSVPIYSFAIGSYDGSTNLLKRLSDETGGVFRYISDANAVLGLLETLLVPVSKSPLSRIAELEGDGREREISVLVPHDQADIMSVVFESTLPLSGLQIERNGLAEGLRFFGGRRYSALSVPKPKSGEYILKFTAPENASVQVFTLYGYSDIRCELILSEPEPDRIEATLLAYNRGDEISDVGFYESLRARVSFSESPGNESFAADMDAEERGAVASYSAENPGKFFAEAMIESLVFLDSAYSANIEIEEKEKPFPLIPFITGATILLLAIILIAMLFRRKPPILDIATAKYSYAGKLVIYVIKSASGTEYPPAAFVLAGCPTSRPLSLAEILRFSVGDDLGADGVAKISFAPGPDHSLVFRHSTSGTIMLGPLVTAPGESYIMDYGAKLYFMLQNELTEIEIHYKMAGPKEFCFFLPEDGKA